jgi:type VI secretion system protein ImpH
VNPGDPKKVAGAVGAKPGAPVAPAEPVAPKPRLVTLEDYLFHEGFGFDFFQAVRLLERLEPKRTPVGRGGPPHDEVVRFRAHLSLNFPPSSIYDIAKPTSSDRPFTTMTVSFMGLTGPSGVLPRHYTELLLRLDKEAKGPERWVLREFLDLFNHRLIAQFFRAWEKYRFFIPYERGEYDRPEPDPFTRCLFSLVGVGMPPLRRRLAVSLWEQGDEQPHERPLARIDDLTLLHFSGFLAHRPRNAVSLQSLLHDYFRLPVRVEQFHGQWLRLERENQTRMGLLDGNNDLGINAVAGERVWDVQSKIRVRLGPLSYRQFNDFLPDLTPVPQRKAIYLASHLIRMYVGPEMDFSLQLVLASREVPECQLAMPAAEGSRLGWNTWVRSAPCTSDAEDAVFEGEEPRWLNEGPSVSALLGMI